MDGTGIELELFKPNFTDDESEDNDVTEEESVSDGESSHSSDDPKSEV
jgi:hypothetical protein